MLQVLGDDDAYDQLDKSMRNVLTASVEINNEESQVNQLFHLQIVLFSSLIK